jgi:hypothetical protein
MKSIPESCDIPSLSRVRDFFNMEFCGLEAFEVEHHVGIGYKLHSLSDSGFVSVNYVARPDVRYSVLGRLLEFPVSGLQPCSIFTYKDTFSLLEKLSKFWGPRVELCRIRDFGGPLVVEFHGRFDQCLFIEPSSRDSNPRAIWDGPDNGNSFLF